VLFETAAAALFLARFGSDPLPFMYLAAAGLSLLAGLGYSRLERRLSFGTLMMVTLGGLAVLAGGLRLGLALTSSAVLVFSLLVWYRLVSILTDLEYWAVATRLYDVRQAKRLFGLIGSGEVAARIVGALSVPLLLRVIGVADLLLLSGASLVSCVVLVRRVLRATEGGAEPVTRAGPAPREEHMLRRLVGEPYVRLLLAVAALAVLGKYLVDFAFLEQMRARHAEAGALASFFALFSGTTQASSLLVRLFVSGRLLRRRGVAFGLLVLPVAHSLCALAVVVAGLLPGAQGLVFWLVIGNQGLYKVLKHPVDNASFKVLYQPLEKGRRLATQIAVETILTPAMVALAAAIMWIFSTALRFQPFVFAIVMLAGFVAWVLAARRAGRAYGTALVAAVRGRLAHDDAFSPADPENLALLRRALSGRSAVEVVFALELIERHAPEQLSATIVGLLRHPAPEVRRVALERAARFGVVAARGGVRSLRTRERVPSVLAEVPRTLAVLEGQEARGAIADLLAHADAKVRYGALVGVLVCGAAEARGRLRDLAGGAVGERALAARAIGDAGREEYGVVLARLLRDPEGPVHDAALRAARRIATPATVQALLACLPDRRKRRLAARALAAAGGGALPVLEQALARPALDVGDRVRLLRIAGRSRDERAVAIGLEALSAADPRVRAAALESPALAGLRLAPAEGRGAEEALERERALAEAVLEAVESLPRGAPWRALHQALEAELEAGRASLLRLLGLLHGPSELRRVRENLDHPSRERRAIAFEVLDVSLPTERRERFVPLVERMTGALRAGVASRSGGASSSPSGRALRALLGTSAVVARPWTRISIILTAARGGMYGLVNEIRAATREAEAPLVREAARSALDRLGLGEGAAPEPLGEAMETITKVIYLKGVRLFAQAPEDVLLDVAAVLEELEVPAGTTVFRQGDRGDSLYIVAAGSVRVHTEAHTINVLGPHDVFGEMALLDPEPRAASVTAETDVHLLRLDREPFVELMDDHIEIVRGVVAMLCERLRQTVPVDPPAVPPPAMPS